MSVIVGDFGKQGVTFPNIIVRFAPCRFIGSQPVRVVREGRENVAEGKSLQLAPFPCEMEGPSVIKLRRVTDSVIVTVSRPVLCQQVAPCAVTVGDRGTVM